ATEGEGEQAEDEQVCLSRTDLASDVAVGDERALEDGVVAAGSTHAERVPGLFDGVVGGVARDERVDDLRAGGVVGIHCVRTHSRPYRGQATEHLVPGDAVSAVHALRLRG